AHPPPLRPKGLPQGRRRRRRGGARGTVLALAGGRRCLSFRGGEGAADAGRAGTRGHAYGYRDRRPLGDAPAHHAHTILITSSTRRARASARAPRRRAPWSTVRRACRGRATPLARPTSAKNRPSPVPRPWRAAARARRRPAAIPAPPRISSRPRASGG